MIYSYTLINTFHDVCPRQAYERFWLKLPVRKSLEMLQGETDHEYLEQRLRRLTPLPEHLKTVEPICASICSRGFPSVESKVAVNRDLAPTDFFDKNGYLRGVFDVDLTIDTGSVIIDWKTGKPREGGIPLQLMIFAALKFAIKPEVQSLTCFNVYTKTGEVGTAHNWRRSELPELWRHILPLIHEIEQAEMDQKFVERPGPLCKWCPVTACAHNRSKELATA